MIAASEPAAHVIVFRILAMTAGAGLLALAVAAVVFAGIETFRRAAVLPLAVRYASSRWINVVSVAGVALGVAALVIVLSVMNGFISTQRRTIRGSRADLTIQPRSRQAGDGISRMPGRFADYAKALAGCPHVAALAPRFVWYGLLFPDQILDIFNLSRKGEDFVIELRGIDPVAERKVTDLDRWIGPLVEDDLGITSGERPYYEPVRDPRDPFAKIRIPDELEKESMILGVSKAMALRVGRGDRVEIASIGPNSSRENPSTPNMYFRVAGMFHTEEQEFDFKTALVTIPALQKFLSAPDVDFTEIAVKLDDYRNADAARAEIEARLLPAGLLDRKDLGRQLMTWEEQKSVLLAAVDNERSLLGFILFFIVIVAAFILFATLSMMVTEKTRDIGILSTLGASWGEVLAVFVDVGLAMILAGEALGVGLGLLIAKQENLNAIERFLDHSFGLKLFNPDVYLLKHLPSEIDASQVLIIVTATLTAGILFSIVPAIRAARLDPARALRYE